MRNIEEICILSYNFSEPIDLVILSTPVHGVVEEINSDGELIRIQGNWYQLMDAKPAILHA